MFGQTSSMDYGRSVNFMNDAQRSTQVQTALQERFDVNSVRLEELAKQVTNLPILQKDAQRYLGERIQGALNIVQANLKATGGQGLLSNSASLQLGRTISSAIDDKVKEHLRYSAQIQNFEQGVAKLKEKDPKTYNQANYEFAKYKAGYEQYLNGTVDTKLGNLEYKPYAGDPTEKLLKRAKDFKDLRGDEVVETPDPNDPAKKIIRKVSGLTSDEIIKYFPSLIDSDSDQQMMIDGWYEYKDNPNRAKADYRNLTEQSNKNIDNQIKILESINESTDSKEKVQDAKRLLDIYKNKREENNKGLEFADKMPVEQLGYYLKKNSFMNSFAQLAGARENVTYELDDVWKAKEDLAIDRANLRLREEELAMKKAENKLKKNPDGTYSSDTSLSPNEVSFNPVSGEQVPEPVDYYDKVQKAYNNVYNEMTEIYKPVFNDITDLKAKDAFIASMKTNGWNYNPKKNDFEKIPGSNYKSLPSAMQVAFYYSRLDKLSPRASEVEAKASELEIERLRIAKVLEDAKNKAIKAGEFEREFITNPNSEQVFSGGSMMPIIPDSGYKKTGKFTGKIIPKKEAVGNYLKDSADAKYILSKNEINITGDSAKNLIKTLPVDTMSGEQFSDKPNITVYKDEGSKQYIIREYKGVTAKGQQKYATSTVSFDSTAAQILKNSIDERDSKLVSTDFNRGETIVARKQHRLYDFNKEKRQISEENGRIDSVIKDPDLNLGLKTTLSKEKSQEYLSILLEEKGMNSDQAKQVANNIVDKVNRKKLRSDLVSNTLGWDLKLGDNIYELTEGTSLSKEILHAQQMFPAQFTLYSIINQIEKANDLNEIQEIID